VGVVEVVVLARKAIPPKSKTKQKKKSKTK
jgi:hypothetical protein